MLITGFDVDMSIKITMAENLKHTAILHNCTNCSNLEMEPKNLTKSDVQLNPNVFRTKNDKWVLQKALE